MYKFLIETIPRKIKNFLFQKYKKKILSEHSRNLLKNRTKQIQLPRHDLLDKHIINLKVLKNRRTLLEVLPQNGIVAEFGVDSGNFSKLILDITKPKKLHLIDTWATDRYRDSKSSVFRKFAKEIEDGLVVIDIGFSNDVLEKYNDKHFDWVYIDTDHSYNTTKRELELASKKVIENGLICGHDYYMGNWVTGYKYGVIEAVHEFCVMHGWEIVYLTIEQSIPPSFAIKKIL